MCVSLCLVCVHVCLSVFGVSRLYFVFVCVMCIGVGIVLLMCEFVGLCAMCVFWFFGVYVRCVRMCGLCVCVVCVLCVFYCLCQ